MYVTREPCNDCWDLMRTYGVVSAVWEDCLGVVMQEV